MGGLCCGAWLLLLLVLVLLPVLPGCRFPVDWQGSWHHLGFHIPINVSVKHIVMHGEGTSTCVDRLGAADAKDNAFGRFIVKEEKGSCYKCMIIYQKHYNVLQYKQSDCEGQSDIVNRGVEELKDICDEIEGDAVMSSMFRVNSQSIACPLQGPYSVGYSQGGAPGLCTYPPSMMDTCTDKTIAQFQFQACPDHKGSESSVEQMVCVAHWKEGHQNYLVGRLNHSHSHRVTERDQYQCFLYEGREPNIQMSQGQFHGSCRGLWSVNEGKRVFSLTKLRGADRCSLPGYFSLHPSWDSLDSSLRVRIGEDGSSFSMEGHKSLHHLTCYSIQEQESGNHMEKIIAHVKAGCESGYVCVQIVKRDDDIISLSTGHWSRHPSEACHSLYLNSQTRQNQTLVSTSRSRPCPFMGRYKVEGEGWGGAPCSAYMQAGCSNSHTLHWTSHCQKGNTINNTEINKIRLVNCHGLWEEGGRMKLVVSSQDSRLHCLDYVDNEGVAMGSFTQGSCKGENSLNMTSTGPCTLALTGQANPPSIPQLYVILVMLLCLVNPYSLALTGQTHAPISSSPLRFCTLVLFLCLVRS